MKSNTKEIMRNNLTIRLVLGLIAACLLSESLLTANAQQLAKRADLRENRSKTVASLVNSSNSFDDFNDSPCKRFPKDQTFDSFEKAFQTPEKVSCLDLNFEGDDLNMKQLPAELGSLVNLKVLSFACLEELKTLPEEIGNLRKLEELIIDNGNGCAMGISLPASIGNLENLRILRLYGAIESSGDRKTKILPDTIANLRRLEFLDLGRNGLETVPPEIAALSNLKTLRLEYNALRSVPAFIGNFKNLKELSLDANENITNLPLSLAKHKGLKVSMGNNALKLKDQKNLQSRFPQIAFSFENEYDDSRANEEPRKIRSTRRKQ